MLRQMIFLFLCETPTNHSFGGQQGPFFEKSGIFDLLGAPRFLRYNSGFLNPVTLDHRSEKELQHHHVGLNCKSNTSQDTMYYSAMQRHCSLSLSAFPRNPVLLHAQKYTRSDDDKILIHKISWYMVHLKGRSGTYVCE